MSSTELLSIAAATLSLISLIVLILVYRRLGAQAFPDLPTIHSPVFEKISLGTQTLEKCVERVEKALREEMAISRSETNTANQKQREELTGIIQEFGKLISARIADASDTQKERLEAVGKQVEGLVQANDQGLAKIREALTKSSLELKEEVGSTIQRFTESSMTQTAELGKLLKSELEAFSGRLDGFSQNNDQKLALIQKTIQESLQLVSDNVLKQTGNLDTMIREQLALFLGQLEEMKKGTGQSLETVRTTVEAKLGQMLESLTQKSDQMREETGAKMVKLREEVVAGLSEGMRQVLTTQKGQAELIDTRLTRLGEMNEKRLETLRGMVDGKLTAIQEENSKKLEEMRATVDEKLRAQLENRIGEHFKQVSERLEQVYKALGEMQSLSVDVGNLSRTLSNVKTRGTLGEYQLEKILEQMFAPGQYEKNVCTKAGSSERVEFAIKQPSPDGGEVLLPIDAKFPTEDYERLAQAREAGDKAGMDSAGRMFENRIKGCAKDICDKYINPPATTGFGILFLPTERLFAEVLERPGLFESVMRDHKVLITGPTTLSAVLCNAHQNIVMMSISRQAADVLKVLGAVKTEFGKFGIAIEKAEKGLHFSLKHISSLQTRRKAMDRRLKGVEALPSSEAISILGDIEVLPPGAEEEDALEALALEET